MEWEEKERRALINKLKTVRDPRERDRIMQILAGGEPGAPLEHAGPTAKQEQVQIPPKTAGVLLGVIVPGFFIAFGLMYIVNALIRLISGEADHDAMVKLIMGGLFLIFGFVGFAKSRKMRKVMAGEKSGAPPAEKPGVWRRS